MVSVNRTYEGDVREVIGSFPDSFLDLVVTSPPYFRLRKYKKVPDFREIGREKKPNEFVYDLVQVFSKIKKSMKDSGSVWVNLDDTYRAGSPLLIPESFAAGMVEDGWLLRNKIIWYKPDAMSESVEGRFTRKYEMFYWFTKGKEYYFDKDATNIPVRLNTVKRMEYNFNASKAMEQSRMRGIIGDMSHKIDDMLEGGVACGDVWLTPTNKIKVDHPAPFSEELIARPIIACCPEGGLVLDPFMGSGTTGMVCQKLARNWIGIELYKQNAEYSNWRCKQWMDQNGLSLFLPVAKETGERRTWFEDVQLELFAE